MEKHGNLVPSDVISDASITPDSPEEVLQSFANIVGKKVLVGRVDYQV